MPRRDKTGPLGQGPRTGWGAGSCWGNMGHGWGYWGSHHGFRRYIPPKNLLVALEEEEKLIEEELSAIREEIASLKDQKK